ncbi:hypothetical protein PR202_gb11594 [Eleusine coracana subsp. coracana]|uniref:YABBY N-terminal domain-containing protein n=1 Tax=Eleusine coracana subsp. coracana TaxID=191504 RepID=A0AAV5END6_ELECO|nr:hypothetical protein PR202_gb11594 [Eleusine coracana subsp. coracana]
MIIATLVNEFIQRTESILVVIDLQVSVPGNTMLNIVTVRCGHCTSLLSVNLRGLIQSLPVQNHLQWAHFPNIHFGLGPNESSKKLDEAIGASSRSQNVIGASSRSQKVQGLY